jgi:hypothetical protein
MAHGGWAVSDHSINLAILVLTGVILVLTAIMAWEPIERIWSRWRGDKAMPPVTPARRQWPMMTFTIVASLLFILIALKEWNSPSGPIGFDSDWPDAISCQWKEPHMAPNQKTNFIFYLQTTGTPRTGLHDVASYFMAGGCMVDVVEKGTGRKLHDYLPHEIWFDGQTKQIIKPENLPASLDDFEVKYKACFMTDIVCGGDTIEDIKKSGHAFSLARGH